MKTFTIDNENNISVFAGPEEAAAATTTPFDSFASEKDLAELIAGQPAISSARSFSLAKESKGVVVAAAASSGPANTLMLFSLSMVNVFILNLLLFRAYAVMDMDHSVPPRRQGNCSRKSNDGEGLAMHRAQVAENGRKWQESEAKAGRSDPCAPDDHERGTGCSRRQNRTQDAVSMAAGAGVRQGLSEGTS